MVLCERGKGDKGDDEVLTAIKGIDDCKEGISILRILEIPPEGAKLKSLMQKLIPTFKMRFQFQLYCIGGVRQDTRIDRNVAESLFWCLPLLRNVTYLCIGLILSVHLCICLAQPAQQQSNCC